MSYKCSILSLFFLTITFINNTFSQLLVKGIVKDADTKEALSFVNIGIKGKEVGTTSLSNGSFELQVAGTNENDTLTFSMVGYSELNLPLIKGKLPKEIFLKAGITQLNTVAISAPKLVERQFGINARPLIRLGDGSTNQKDIFEIAQLIKIDTGLSKITAVNLYINQFRKDSGVFRINFYAFDGTQPITRILEKSIIETKAIQAGWLKFDLRKYNIFLKGNFVVAVEFIPSEETALPIYYGIKLGGSSKSFVRTHSQGGWGVPPHHYRIFVNALVDVKKKKNAYEDVENKESSPTVALYSTSVNDSFSIFINLPTGYNNNKRRLPVVFLLDANVYFDVMANEMREKKINAILVGVGYKDFILMDSLRNRDYTYPVAEARFGFLTSGGADKFLLFLETELIPYIKEKYRVDVSKLTLEGHSLGGYFTLFALTKALRTSQQVFSNYIAASPSLHYSKYIMEQLQHPPDNPRGRQTLFMTYGGMEDSEGGEITTEGIDNFNALTTLLNGNKFSNIKLKHKVFPTFRHMETAIPTFSESLHLIK